MKSKEPIKPGNIITPLHRSWDTRTISERWWWRVLELKKDFAWCELLYPERGHYAWRPLEHVRVPREGELEQLPFLLFEADDDQVW